MEDGGICGRSSRHWDEISLCYPCLAQQQHLLAGEDKAFTEAKLLVLANLHFPWGRVEERYLEQAIKSMHKVCLGQAKYILLNQITLDFPEKSVTLASLSISARILHPDGNKVVPCVATQQTTEGFIQASYIFVSSFTSLVTSLLTVEAGCQHMMSEFSRNIRSGALSIPI